MQDYHTNIAFNQLSLVAFSLGSKAPVKGARRVALCAKPGIYMPLTGAWLAINFANKAVD
jgi:hypothetical protein